jgi:hypothetical protein
MATASRMRSLDGSAGGITRHSPAAALPEAFRLRHSPPRVARLEQPGGTHRRMVRMRIAVIAAAITLVAVTACRAGESRRSPAQPQSAVHSVQSDPFSAAVRFARQEFDWPSATPQPCYVDATCADDPRTVYVYRSLPCPTDGTRACEVAVVTLRRTPTGVWAVATCEFIPNALATTRSRQPCH